MWRMLWVLPVALSCKPKGKVGDGECYPSRKCSVSTRTLVVRPPLIPLHIGFSAVEPMSMDHRRWVCLRDPENGGALPVAEFAHGQADGASTTEEGRRPEARVPGRTLPAAAPSPDPGRPPVPSFGPFAALSGPSRRRLATFAGVFASTRELARPPAGVRATARSLSGCPNGLSLCSTGLASCGKALSSCCNEVFWCSTRLATC